MRSRSFANRKRSISRQVAVSEHVRFRASTLKTRSAVLQPGLRLQRRSHSYTWGTVARKYRFGSFIMPPCAGVYSPVCKLALPLGYSLGCSLVHPLVHPLGHPLVLWQLLVISSTQLHGRETKGTSQPAGKSHYLTTRRCASLRLAPSPR